LLCIEGSHFPHRAFLCSSILSFRLSTSFSDRFVLTFAPTDSTTFAGLGPHPDTRIVRLVSITLVCGPGTTFNICLFNLLSAEAREKLQSMSAFSLRTVGCQE